MKSCSFCLKADIADKAIRCHHCGSWVKGLAQLEELVRQRVTALSFNLGGRYYGPIIWKHFETLQTLPEFRLGKTGILNLPGGSYA